MIARILIVGLLLLGMAGRAAEITLIDGRTFRDASVMSQTPRTVVIKHADGLSSVSKTILPPELVLRYPIDEAAAREAESLSVAAQAKAQEFHKAEAARSAQLSREREEAVVLNTNLAIQKAAAHQALEAEATRIAAQRTEIVYEYVPLRRSSYFTDRDSPSCEPHWTEKNRRNHFVRHDHFNDRERNSNANPPRTRNHVNNDHAENRLRSTQPATGATQVNFSGVKRQETPGLPSIVREPSLPSGSPGVRSARDTRADHDTGARVSATGTR